MNKGKYRIVTIVVAVLLSALFFVLYGGSDVYAFSMNTSYGVLNDYSSRYYYEFLDDEQKAAYDELEKKFMERCFDYDNLPVLQSVTLTIYDMSKEKVDEIANAFYMDHYYLYWMYTYSYSYGKANIIKVMPNSRYNKYSEKEIQNQYKAICEKTAEVLNEVSKYSTDEQKAYYIYTWITENASYAYDENGEPSELPIDHSMYGNIVNGSSVCEGFAETFTYLCTACGIPNAVVLGECDNGSGNEAHVWNVIKLGEKYYYVDTTWDEALSPDNYQYAFVAMNDELINSNHFTDDGFVMPEDSECATSNLKLDDIKKFIKYPPYRTISLSLSPADSKIKIYNNGLEVPITDNKFTVTEGTTIKLTGADSRLYSFYNGAVVSTRLIKDDTITISSSVYGPIYVRSRKPKVTGYELYFNNVGVKNETWFFTSIYIVTETGKIDKTVKFDITLDQDTKDRADAIKAGDYYIPSSFDEKYLPGVRQYKSNYTKTQAANDGLDTTEDIPEYLIPVEYEKNCKLTLNKINGVEAKAYYEDGTRIYSGTMIPYGTHVILKAAAQDGEADDSFLYSDSKVSNVQLDGKGFIITDNTSITCQASVISVAEVNYEKEVDVNNGTLPAVDLLGLSSLATIKTEDGLIKTYPINWDLSNYDYLDKSARDVAVTGTVSIADGTYTLKDGVTLSTETTLHVNGASNLSSLETEIPSSITVPAGTLRNYYALELPISAEFKNSAGDTIKSEIIWTAGEGNPYEMTGTVKRNGYTFDPIVVTVTEVGETLSLIPDVNVDYDINNKKTNVLSPVASENIIAHINIQSINTHKDRKVVVKIPKGFTGVGVANATLLDGINDVQIVNNDDGTTDVNVEVDDSFKDGYLTFDVAMNSTFTEIKWGSGLGENDIGRLYPSFSDIPIIISYVAKEDGTSKSIDLDYNEHLTMGGGIEYMAEPSFTNYLNLSVPMEKYQDSYAIPSYDLKVSKNTSYLEDFQIIYPINEKLNCEIISHRGGTAVFDEDSNSIIYTRGKGDVYTYAYNRDKQYPNNDHQYNIYYKLHAKDDSDINAGMTYSSDKPIYAVGVDYFGNEYIRTFNKKMSLYIWPYDENTNIYIESTSISRVKDDSDLYNFDMAINVYKSIENSSIKPINDMELKFEIPEGTTVAGMEMVSRASKVKFVYWDGTSEEISISDIKNNYDSERILSDFIRIQDSKSLNVLDTPYKDIYYFGDDISNRGDDGIKEFIITFDSIKDVYKGEVRLLLSGTHNYTDNTRVEYGSYFTLYHLPDDYETDCPVTEMPITLSVDNKSRSTKTKLFYEVATSNTMWECGGYCDSPYKTTQGLTFYGLDYCYLSKFDSDVGEVYITDNTTIYDTVISSEQIMDPEVFSLTGMTITYGDIKVDDYSSVLASFTCTDGNTYDLDLVGYMVDGELTYNAPDGEGIVDYNIYIEEMEIGTNNIIEIRKTYTVDWDKWIEKGYVADQAYDVSSFCVASRNEKEDSYDAATYVEGTVITDYSFSTSQMTKNYDNETAESITAISALEQTEGCTLTFSYKNSSKGVLLSEYGTRSLGVSLPLVFDEITIGISTGNQELKVCDEEMPELYDADGNVLGVADKIEYTGGLYILHFEDITLDNVSEIFTQFRVEPTSSIQPGAYNLSCIVLSATPDGEAMQALWDEQELSAVHGTMVMDKFKQSLYKYNKTYRETTINVLTAYSENATMYGRTAESQDNTLTEYNVEGEETYDAVLHIFSGPDKKLSGFETTINIPRSNTNITVNGKTYTNTFDGTFAGVSAGSGVVNPHYFYKKAASEDGEEAPEYVEFSGNAADIENPEEVIAIMVTADSVTNDDEITIKLKAPEADAKRESYIYSDIKYDGGNKSISTNVVEYILGAGLAPFDPGTQGGGDPGSQGGDPKPGIASVTLEKSIEGLDAANATDADTINAISFEIRKATAGADPSEDEGELVKTVKLGDDFELNADGAYVLKEALELETPDEGAATYYLVETTYEVTGKNVAVTHKAVSEGATQDEVDAAESEDGAKAVLSLSKDDNKKLIYTDVYTDAGDPGTQGGGDPGTQGGGDPGSQGGDPKPGIASVTIEKSIEGLDAANATDADTINGISFEIRKATDGADPSEDEGELIKTVKLGDDFELNADGVYVLKEALELETPDEGAATYYLVETSYEATGKNVAVTHKTVSEDATQDEIDATESEDGTKAVLSLSKDDKTKLLYTDVYTDAEDPGTQGGGDPGTQGGDPGSQGGDPKPGIASITIEKSIEGLDAANDADTINGISFEIRKATEGADPAEDEGDLVKTVSIGENFELNADGVYVLKEALELETPDEGAATYYLVETSYEATGKNVAVTHKAVSEDATQDEVDATESEDGTKAVLSLSKDDKIKAVYTDVYTDAGDPGTQGGGDPGTQGGGDPGTQGGEDPGSQGEEPGVQGGEDPGSQGEEPGVQGGEDPGTQGEEPGVQGEEPGVQGEEPGTQIEEPEIQGGETATPGMQGGESEIPEEQEEIVTPVEQETVEDQGSELVTPEVTEEQTEVTTTEAQVAETTTESTSEAQVTTYTISFDLNGGTLNGETGVITMVVEAGTVITIPEAPIKEGYEFIYWMGSEYYPGDSYTVTGDHTFTAQWKKVAEVSKNTNTTGNNSAVNTGDDTNLILYIALLLVSLLGICIIIRKRRNG